ENDESGSLHIHILATGQDVVKVSELACRTCILRRLLYIRLPGGYAHKRIKYPFRARLFMLFVGWERKMKVSKNETPFITDVEELRARARKSINNGAITPAYQADVKQTIEILQSVLATEIVCVLRYTMNAVAAAGISS